MDRCQRNHKNSLTTTSSHVPYIIKITTYEKAECFQYPTNQFPLELLGQTNGDQDIIQPETGNRPRLRYDKFKTPIVKHQKSHKVCFKDQIQDQELCTVHFVEILQYDEESGEEQCPCIIF